MRNIIICCDGTGNEISENISNVLKLYRCLRKTEKTQPRQLVFYDPGVGTLARPDPWHKLKQDFNAILGLATGYGLDDNVLAAYAFLVHTLSGGRPDLSVRLFPRRLYRAGAGGADPQDRPDHAGAGQSRRLRPDRLQAVLQRRGAEAAREIQVAVDAAAAEDALPQTAFDNAAQFARITSARWPTIRFVGVWDTVASVIVPRADRFYWPSLEELAFTLLNPSVQTFRQAISIDERRCMFRLKKWDAPQTYKPVRFNDVASRAAGYPAGVVRRRACRYRRRLSGKAMRPFEISAALDDRRGENAGSRSTRPTSTSSPGAFSARAARSPMSRLMCAASCITRCGRVVDARIPAEEREVQGVAGAEGAFRLLHSGRRTAGDSGRRDHP